MLFCSWHLLATADDLVKVICLVVMYNPLYGAASILRQFSIYSDTRSNFHEDLLTKSFLWWCGVNFHLTYHNKYEFPLMDGIQQGSICDKSAFFR